MARSSFSRSSLSSSSSRGGGGRLGVFFFLCCFHIVFIFIAVCCASVDVMMVFASDSSSHEEGFGDEDEHVVKSFKVSRNLGSSLSSSKEEEKEKVASMSSSSNALLDLASNKKHGEEIQFPLWHSLEYFINNGNNKEEVKEEEFVKVGTISGTIVLENNNMNNNEKSSNKVSTKFRLKDVKVHRDEMTSREKDQLQSLAKKGRKYRVRVPANVLAPSGNAYAQAASPARCVVTSRLRESFTLHMDDSGNVLAVDYDAECPQEVHLGGGEEASLGEADGGGDDEDASLFIADGAQFRSVATARFPKRAPQLNADAAMTDVRGHGGPMDAKKAQEIKTRRARGEKVDATTKELTWFQRNYMWVVPVAYFMFMNMVQEQGGGGGGGGGAPATPATQKKSN